MLTTIHYAAKLSQPGPVTTWMGDGKPSQYVPKNLGQLSLPSLPGRLIEYNNFVT